MNSFIEISAEIAKPKVNYFYWKLPFPIEGNMSSTTFSISDLSLFFFEVNFVFFLFINFGLASAMLQVADYTILTAWKDMLYDQSYIIHFFDINKPSSPQYCLFIQTIPEFNVLFRK